MRRTVRLALIFLVVCLGAFAVSAQDCPADKVCISREAALKALADADRVKALEAEIKVKDQAYADLGKLLNDMRVEFARCSGEATILKQRAVSDLAVIELLMKNTRKKSIGLIAF